MSAVASSPLARHATSPADLQARLAAARRGRAHLVLRDDGGLQHLVELDGRLAVGRSEACALQVGWDAGVSRTHAEICPAGCGWTISDLSRNGTWVNGERVSGSRRLADGDLIRLGATTIAFLDPAAQDAPTRTVAAPTGPSAAQQRVLACLCQLRAARGRPPKNAELAAELGLGIEAVRTHLRALYVLVGVDDEPQERKREALAERALAAGLVRPGDPG
ncbi:MAG TPA: FHA domain-containing protein [Baekduia sp.]|nr:FHA domain-containing protein [Baekduia sp.]